MGQILKFKTVRLPVKGWVKAIFEKYHLAD